MLLVDEEKLKGYIVGICRYYNHDYFGADQRCERDESIVCTTGRNKCPEKCPECKDFIKYFTDGKSYNWLNPFDMKEGVNYITKVDFKGKMEPKFDFSNDRGVI